MWRRVAYFFFYTFISLYGVSRVFFTFPRMQCSSPKVLQSNQISKLITRQIHWESLWMSTNSDQIHFQKKTKLKLDVGLFVLSFGWCRNRRLVLANLFHFLFVWLFLVNLHIHIKYTWTRIRTKRRHMSTARLLFNKQRLLNHINQKIGVIFCIKVIASRIAFTGAHTPHTKR